MSTVTVSTGQTYNVSFGQTDTFDTVNVLSGGALGTTTDYGIVNVSSGGFAFGTIVDSGGTEIVSAGGGEEAGFVNTGGVLDVLGTINGMIAPEPRHAYCGA